MRKGFRKDQARKEEADRQVANTLEEHQPPLLLSQRALPGPHGTTLPTQNQSLSSSFRVTRSSFRDTWREDNQGRREDLRKQEEVRHSVILEKHSRASRRNRASLDIDRRLIDLRIKAETNTRDF